MSSYSWPPKGPYEYRALERSRPLEGEWSNWNRLGNRLAYGTIASARTFITRKKKDIEEQVRRWGPRKMEREWKIQRRPVDQWEDFE